MRSRTHAVGDGAVHKDGARAQGALRSGAGGGVARGGAAGHVAVEQDLHSAPLHQMLDPHVHLGQDECLLAPCHHTTPREGGTAAGNLSSNGPGSTTAYMGSATLVFHLWPEQITVSRTCVSLTRKRGNGSSKLGAWRPHRAVSGGDGEGAVSILHDGLAEAVVGLCGGHGGRGACGGAGGTGLDAVGGEGGAIHGGAPQGQAAGAQLCAAGGQVGHLGGSAAHTCAVRLHHQQRVGGSGLKQQYGFSRCQELRLPSEWSTLFCCALALALTATQAPGGMKFILVCVI